MEDWKATKCRSCKTGIYMNFGEGDGLQDILECTFCEVRVCRYGDPPDTTIKRNAAQCRKCNDVIESVHCHDFKRCSCGAIYVDGGKSYLKRGGNFADLIELAEPTENNNDCNALN